MKNEIKKSETLSTSSLEKEIQNQGKSVKSKNNFPDYRIQGNIILSNIIKNQNGRPVTY